MSGPNESATSPPPRVPRRWPRTAWERSRRYGSFAYRWGLRPLLGLGAVVGAVIVVVDAYPRAHDSVFWRDNEYQDLRAIHAGHDYAFVEDRLGVPTQSRALGDTGFLQRIYVRRDAYAQVVTDPDGRVVLYSVTSCDADFRPTFDSGDFTPVQLQERPLSETPLVEGVDPAKEDASAAIRESMRTGSRSLDYLPPATGSTPEHYLEWTGPGSTATLGRSYFVGVNPACVGDPIRAGARDHYSGPLEEAPEGLLRVRERYAANTYAETAMPLTPILDDLGMLVLAGRGESDFSCAEEPTLEGNCSRVTVGVFWFELPGRMRGGNTRTFD